MNAYYPKDSKGERHSIYDPIEDIDLTDALTDIVKTAVVNNIKDYRTSIEKDESGDETKSVKAQLDGTLQRLQDLGPQLQRNLEEIENSNNELTKNINDQLQQYADLQKRLESISNAQESSNLAQTKTDVDLSALGS